MLLDIFFLQGIFLPVYLHFPDFLLGMMEKIKKLCNVTFIFSYHLQLHDSSFQYRSYVAYCYSEGGFVLFQGRFPTTPVFLTLYLRGTSQLCFLHFSRVLINPITTITKITLTNSEITLKIVRFLLTFLDITCWCRFLL